MRRLSPEMDFGVSVNTTVGFRFRVLGKNKLLDTKVVVVNTYFNNDFNLSNVSLHSLQSDYN